MCLQNILGVPDGSAECFSVSAVHKRIYERIDRGVENRKEVDHHYVSHSVYVVERFR